MEALQRATGEKREVALITDDEVVKLCETTNESCVYEVQRKNILVFSHQTGMRPETLARLRVGSFERGVLPDGRRFLRPVIGTMKNKQGRLEKVEEALFHQMIIQHSDARCVSSTVATIYRLPVVRLCAVRAIEHQIQLLGPDAAPDSWLFRSVRNISKELGVQQGHAGLYRGVYQWAQTVLGRQLTFRDMSRRVVMTRLANDPNLSTDDAAKYMGVTTRTISVYHRTNDERRQMAAEVLSRTSGKGEVCNDQVYINAKPELCSRPRPRLSTRHLSPPSTLRSNQNPLRRVQRILARYPFVA